MQFEGAGEEGKPEEFGKMEVDEEADSKKKLDQRKKEFEKQLRKIDAFPDMPQSVVFGPKEKWQEELQDIEQRRNDLLPGASEDAEKIAKAAKLARQKEAMPEGYGQVGWRS